MSEPLDSSNGGDAEASETTFAPPSESAPSAPSSFASASCLYGCLGCSGGVSADVEIYRDPDGGDYFGVGGTGATGTPAGESEDEVWRSELMDLFIPISIQHIPFSSPPGTTIFTYLEVINDGSEGFLSEDTAPNVRIVYLSPDKVPSRANRYDMTLVIDLDETLVDARGNGLALRPFSRQFLELLRTHLPRVELIAWTAGADIHARRVARIYESNSGYRHRHRRPLFDFLIARGPDWYPNGDAPHKDITRLRGRTDTTVILDDSLHVTYKSGAGAVLIKPFALENFPPATSVAPEDDVTLMFALQVIAFVHHVVAKQRPRRPYDDFAEEEREPITLAEKIFADIVQAVIMGGTNIETYIATPECLVTRALRVHPFVHWSLERTIECRKCESRPHGHFTLQTDIERVTSRLGTSEYYRVVSTPAVTATDGPPSATAAAASLSENSCLTE